MTIKDFETAIDAKNCGIAIDEMRLVLRGTVRQCFGHKDSTLIMWDGNGRGFSCQYDGEIDCDTHYNVPMESYNRDKVYDLEFD